VGTPWAHQVGSTAVYVFSCAWRKIIERREVAENAGLNNQRVLALQRGREDSNPRLLVLETSVPPTGYALQSQTSDEIGAVGTHMGTRGRQLGAGEAALSLPGESGSGRPAQYCGAVSAENLEIVRRWLAPATSRSPDDLRAAVEELCDPDIDYYPVRKFPEARPCHGIDELSQFLGRFRESWSRYAWEIKELIQVGDDRILACLNLRAEGRESGMGLEGEMYQCVWLRNGRFFRLEDHLTLSGALRAFGLRGETLEAAGLRSLTNLDLVRSISADWQSGDYSSAEWAHPNIEYVIADGPTPGTWTGLPGMAEGFRAFASAWEQYRIEPAEYRELDDERVLVLFHPSGRGKTSGLELGQVGTKTAGVFHIREGKVRKLVFYMDGDHALADLATSEADFLAS
jgi:ketosteroid isomerase-like protein